MARLLALREDPDYPDSPEGVRKLLEDESDLDLEGARFTPDPEVHGAWLVQLADGRRLLVSVGGHPLAPDFEQEG